MRLVFMGTPDFAVPSLRILCENAYEIAGVVTSPDKPTGRGLKPAASPVKKEALARSLRLFQPDRLNDPSFVSTLSSLAPDLIVVVAFRILPPAVFTLPPKGSINLHASLLPRYRGAAPIHWALIHGETQTGVTTFFLKESVDTGETLLQARLNIGPDETAGELHDRLAEVGAEIVLQTVRLIELGKAIPRPQDDALATPAPKIRKEHCRIVWGNSADQVHNFIRGLSPSPCAWTTFRGTTIRCYRSSRVQETAPHRTPTEPGTVLSTSDELRIRTGDGILSLLEVQQEGRRRLPAGEFLRGFSIREGDRFE